MGPSQRTIRALFCLASALVAAALADFLVELSSNAGLFGHGNFTDHSNADVFPVLILGLGFGLAWGFARLKRSRLRQSTNQRKWLRYSARALDTASILKMLPVIFALQLCALFTMENLEQLAIYGHTFGAEIWLGGPVLISLAVHLFFGAAVAAFIGKAVHALAHTLAGIVKMVRRFIISLDVDGVAKPVCFEQSVLTRRFSRTVCRVGERAPPALLGIS